MTTEEKAKEIVKTFANSKELAMICIEEQIKTANKYISIKKNSGIKVFGEDRRVIEELESLSTEIDLL